MVTTETLAAPSPSLSHRERSQRDHILSQREETRRHIEALIAPGPNNGSVRMEKVWEDYQAFADMHKDVKMIFQYALRGVLGLPDRDLPLRELLKLPLQVLFSGEYNSQQNGVWLRSQSPNPDDFEKGSPLGRLLSIHPRMLDLLRYACANRVNAQEGIRYERDKIKAKDINHNDLTGDDLVSVMRYLINKHQRVVGLTDFMLGEPVDIDPQRNPSGFQAAREAYWRALRRTVELYHLLGVQFAHELPGLSGPLQSLAVLVSEKADVLITTEADIDRLFGEGVRVFNPQYNKESMLVRDEVRTVPIGTGEPISVTDGVLTPLGVRCIKRALLLGMAVDLSHMLKTARDQTIALARAMGLQHLVIYSHGFISQQAFDRGLDRAMAYRRGLDIEQMRQIRDAGGYVGLTPILPFLAKPGGDQDEAVGAFFDHIVFLVRNEGMGGCLFFGMDYEGCERVSIPSRISDYHRLIRAKDELERRGLTPDEIENLFTRNAHRFVVENFSHLPDASDQTRYTFHLNPEPDRQIVPASPGVYHRDEPVRRY